MVNSTKNNLIAILLYALAIAAALGFNDLTKTIMDRYTSKGLNNILSKTLYVVIMIAGTLVLAYYTKSTVPV